MVPFKGKYLKNIETFDLNIHLYPVPNLDMPFLGIHYTITADKTVKIGPSSVPALWRENYKGFQNFSLIEFLENMKNLIKMWLKNKNNMRKLVVSELKKISKKNFISHIKHMTNYKDLSGFSKWTRPGIRAQLINKKNSELEMDFVIEGDSNSIHLLNTISPGFTCSFAIAKYAVDRIAKYQNIK